VLRFDFTGLGSGEFANTNFSSNVEGLIRAADHLRVNFAAPAIMIGHSLGGAAVLAAAGSVPEVRAVVTIGAPADVAHVLRQFSGSLDDIRRNGGAQVTLAGRTFSIRRSFVEDAQEQRLLEHVHKLGRALLIMHAPRMPQSASKMPQKFSRRQSIPRASYRWMMPIIYSPVLRPQATPHG
jgi:pimeloyl-ACP methyl ester carboxylesterase